METKNLYRCLRKACKLLTKDRLDLHSYFGGANSKIFKKSFKIFKEKPLTNKLVFKQPLKM